MTLISCWQRMEVGMTRLGRVLWSAIYCYFIKAVARVCAVHMKTCHARGHAIACRLEVYCCQGKQRHKTRRQDFRVSTSSAILALQLSNELPLH